MTHTTQRQREILKFIADRIRRGMPPTIREIGEQFGIGSTNGVNDHLKALERKEFLLRGETTARGLRITKAGWRELGEHPRACPNCGWECSAGVA